MKEGAEYSSVLFLKRYKILSDDLQVFCNETIFQIFHTVLS